MKQKVNLSTYSVIMTFFILGVLIGIICWQAYKDVVWAIWVLLGIIVSLCSVALYYVPLSISVDEKYLNINRPLRIKSIPLSDINSRTMFPYNGRKTLMWKQRILRLLGSFYRAIHRQILRLLRQSLRLLPHNPDQQQKIPPRLPKRPRNGLRHHLPPQIILDFTTELFAKRHYYFRDFYRFAYITKSKIKPWE